VTDLAAGGRPFDLPLDRLARLLHAARSPKYAVQRRAFLALALVIGAFH